jgi:glycosyltransferase involved in cell wall biosynthesis
MTGEYLRLSPFVFIHREVTGLRSLGCEIETFSIRGLHDSSEAVNPEQRSEAERTYCVLPVSPFRVASVHLSLLVRSPARYGRALRLAWATRPPGLRALLLQLAYFLEAGLVAARMRELGLGHLHNHFASSSGTVAMLAAELGDFSFSISEHGPHIFFTADWWRLEEKFTRALFVCCISNFCRSQIMMYTPVDRWNRLHIVHCGVDPGEYHVRRHSGRGSRLLFTGRLSEMKGIPILLSAIATLKDSWPELIVDLAGDGPDRGVIEAEIQRLGIAEHVRILGYQSSEQVRELLRHADVFVLPSFAEGVPVVLMEAMASGVPVIATRIAGIPELVEDGVSGLLTAPGDSAALVAAIDRLLSDGALRERLARAGRAVIEGEFDTKSEAAWLHRIMTQALKGEIASIRPPS